MIHKQSEMFDERFDGADYKDKRDRPRLTGQLRRIYAFMCDGNWHTLDSIARGTKVPHNSASAQYRNLRKKRFGGHTIDKKYKGNGLYLYRLNKNTGE